MTRLTVKIKESKAGKKNNEPLKMKWLQWQNKKLVELEIEKSKIWENIWHEFNDQTTKIILGNFWGK